MISHVENIDCMEFMKRYPDKYFELAIVDPPYGIKENGGKRRQSISRPNSYHRPLKYERKEWDSETPDQNYFDELFRVSKNRIIWGGNYMIDKIKIPSMGWIFWDKKTEQQDFSDGELAYTSFQRALKKITLHKFVGTMGGKLCIHPTQKPIALYRWLLKNYANEGEKILDTHLGSGSSRIAAYKLGFDFYGCELDKDYYEAQEKRFKEAINEPLFQTIPEVEQKVLFQ